jgi:hypothetical protein
MPLTPFARASIEEYPVLARLVLTSSVEWVFQPTQLPSGQPLLCVWRIWATSGYNDAVTVLDDLNARAFRCDPYGGQVWQREGDVNGVVEGMAELPEPGMRTAPNLVKGTSPSGLWTPGA